MKYLILGNSAAGVSAVDAIRSKDSEGSITMVCPEEDLAYGTPLISYILEGKTDYEHAAIRDEEWYTRNEVTRVFGAGKAACELDAKAKLVTLEDGTQLSYDKLLVAIGSVPSTSGIAGLSDDAANCFNFLSMSDMKAVQSYIDEVIVPMRAQGKAAHAVVMGSGLIGAKASEGLCDHFDTTYMVGHAKRVLRKLLDDDEAPVLQELMQQHGVSCVNGAVVNAVELVEDGKTIKAVTLDNGQTLACDLLVNAIGVRPNTAMLAAAGAQVARGVVCDEHMQTSLPAVYAAGDVACTHDVLTGMDAPLALWPNASEQGYVAGLAMAGDESACFNGAFGRNAVGFFDEMNILGCGIVNPGPEQADCESFVDSDGDSYSKFVVRDGCLCGYLLVNRPEGAGIYTDIIRECIPLDELPDDIFEREPMLRDLPHALLKSKLLKGYVEGGVA